MSIVAASYSPSQQSTWHSPVPYLFGGLAAMLGLIAFALLILACSYWKLTGDSERDLETGEVDGGAKVAPPVMDEKYLVIMAGQEKPTYLATPMTSRASSFGSNCICSASSNESSTLSYEEMHEEQKGGNSRLVEMGNVEAHEAAADQIH